MLWAANYANSAVGIEADAFWRQSLVLCVPPDQAALLQAYSALGRQSLRLSKGLGLPYRSQYDDAVTRAQKAIEKLTARSEGLSKYTRAETRQALQERLLAKEEFLYRVEQQCARDLFVGNRMSVRRACRVAVADRRLR